MLDATTPIAATRSGFDNTSIQRRDAHSAQPDVPVNMLVQIPDDVLIRVLDKAYLGDKRSVLTLRQACKALKENTAVNSVYQAARLRKTARHLKENPITDAASGDLIRSEIRKCTQLEPYLRQLPILALLELIRVAPKAEQDYFYAVVWGLSKTLPRSARVRNLQPFSEFIVKLPTLSRVRAMRRCLELLELDQDSEKSKRCASLAFALRTINTKDVPELYANLRGHIEQLDADARFIPAARLALCCFHQQGEERNREFNWLLDQIQVKLNQKSGYLLSALTSEQHRMTRPEQLEWVQIRDQHIRHIRDPKVFIEYMTARARTVIRTHADHQLSILNQCIDYFEDLIGTIDTLPAANRRVIARLSLSELFGTYKHIQMCPDLMQSIKRMSKYMYLDPNSTTSKNYASYFIEGRCSDKELLSYMNNYASQHPKLLNSLNLKET